MRRMLKILVREDCLTFLAFFAFFAFVAEFGWAGTPEPFGAMERALQEAKQKLEPCMVNVRVTMKPAQGRGNAQGPMGEIKPFEMLGLAIGPSEVLACGSNSQMSKIEVWCNGKWQSATVVGDNPQLAFVVLKTEVPHGRSVAKWRIGTPDTARWVVGVMGSGENENYRFSITPLWLREIMKDPTGLGDLFALGTQVPGVAVVGTFDGEVLGFAMGNSQGRWINDQFLKSVQDAKERGMANKDAKMVKMGDEFRTAWFGFTFLPLTPAYVEALKIPTKKAVRVQGAVPGGPAGLAGIHQDDIVLKFNGKAIEQTGEAAVAELKNALQVKPKEPVKILLWRNGKEMEVTATPEKPPVFKTVSSDELGLTVQEIHPMVAYLRSLPTSKGVIVTHVVPGGPAQYASIYPENPQYGMPMTILTEIAGVPIAQLADMYAALKKVRQSKKEPIFIKGFRGPELFYAVIDLGIGAKRSGGGGGSDEPSGEEEGQP